MGVDVELLCLVGGVVVCVGEFMVGVLCGYLGFYVEFVGGV